ncbi:hypothetical protein TSA6c_16960 [Azospirillum sp. TSA6c]|uniref:hypothetical protein n=1 Tax=Azospirillum sp. TSA6c TaxID=709813 RepID=UPI000D606425|nr:hypothetical protein [Azospirillum sp. TSA6c]PWC48126.1 hypothetical protein TSA6c_16960 [Azospirillum sp. TSA6c]
MIHLVEIGCYVNATSSSTHTVGMGLKGFVLAAGPQATTWMTLRVVATDGSGAWMEGLVAWTDAAGFALSVKATGGSGTHTGWRLAAGTLRFSNEEYDDSSAPGPFEPVITPEGYAQGSVSLHGDGKSFGAADVEKGLVKVINAGLRDHLRRYAYFGRLARELIVTDSDADYSTATVVRTGTVEQPVVSKEDVLFRWRGKLSDLDSRWQGSTFPGGTGAGMSTDGADGLKNLPRPRLRGYRPQIEPVPTNVTGDLRQISDKRIHGVENGRNRGAAITVGVKCNTLQQLKDSAPTSGTFNWYDGSGGDGAWCKTTFGSQGGVFTLAAWEGATATDRTLAQVWRRVLIEDCGYTDSDISGPDVVALDTACPWEAGIWAGTSEKTKRDALNDLCDGVAGYHDDDLGVWRITFDGATAGAPVLTFRELVDDDEDAPLGHVPYVDLELVASNDESRGLPVCAVDVQFAPRDRKLDGGDLAGDSTSATDPVGGADMRTQLSSEYLTETWPAAGKDQTIIDLWGERRLTVKTSLRYRADAQALAQRLFAIHSVLRDRFSLTSFLNEETLAARPGACVAARSSRYGLSAGMTLRVNGRELDGQSMKLDLMEVAV